MKKPYNKLSQEDEKLLREFQKNKKRKPRWDELEGIPLALQLDYDEKLNNENISNGAGYQTAHQVNSAINRHSASDYAHPNKLNCKGVKNLIVCTKAEYDKAPTHKDTLYILVDTKNVYIEDVKII